MTDMGTQNKTSSPDSKGVGGSALLADLEAEAKLMRAAQRFGMAFNENRHWGDDTKRLDFTLTVWRELALASLEYAKSVRQSANDQAHL